MMLGGFKHITEHSTVVNSDMDIYSLLGLFGKQED